MTNSNERREMYELR